MFIFFCTACAKTSVDISSQYPVLPVCQNRDQNLSALVLWGTSWRADQKDVPLREKAAEQGIENFLKHSDCFSRVEIQKISESFVEDSAKSYHHQFDRIVTIKVRELGPTVRLLGSPALVDGGTEVVLDVTSVTYGPPDQKNAFRITWKNGGPGVIKGVSTLPSDMESALMVALRPDAPLQ